MSVQCIGVLSVEQVFCSAPRPVLGKAGEVRRDRVREHVLDRVAEVVVVHDDGRGEAVAEEMSATRMAPVELLRVRAVHALHPGRERRQHALDDEVEVRVHQAPGEDSPVAFEDLAREQAEEEAAVAVVADDRGRVDAQDRDVVHADGGKPASRDSWHSLRR